MISLGATVHDTNSVTGETPLIVAARKGHVDMVSLLLGSGANKSATDKLGDDAFAAATMAGKFDVLQVLIKDGYTINEGRLGPLLILALASGKVNVAEYLLHVGAPVGYLGADGESTLMAAVKSGKVELTNLLLKHGVPVESADSSGRTPLILAAQSGGLDLCEALISAGANIEARDKRGNTPLLWAVLMGHKDVALGLIRKGANVHAMNVANRNALYFATFQQEVTETLIRQGVRLVEISIEDGNYYRSARAYEWLARVLETESLEKRSDLLKTSSDSRRAYDIASRHYESAANQFAKLASEFRAQQTTKEVVAVLFTAASIAGAAWQASHAAHQMAEIGALKSAASGGSGHGVGYGIGAYSAATPDTALAKSAGEYEALAADARERARLCKKKVECYSSAAAGLESRCFSN
jgi:ankyrin repeat protein